MKILDNFSYNSYVIITFFIISFIALVLSFLTRKKTNDLFFSSYKSGLLNPLTYIRLVTHIFGHDSWSHFMNNFLYILLIGPMIEEKYGSKNLIIMIVITAVITGVINSFTKNKILGASGVVFMLIVLSSLSNIESGKIPLTFVLITLFYIIDEVIKLFFKKDNVSHLGHLIGAVCGFIFGYYIF